jgi:hypothetical protein
MLVNLLDARVDAPGEKFGSRHTCGSWWSAPSCQSAPRSSRTHGRGATRVSSPGAAARNNLRHCGQG